jgi:hypothetical protein
MIRARDLALIFVAGLIPASLAFSRPEGDGPEWIPSETRSELFRIPHDPATKGVACASTAATLARWGDLRPSRQTFHALPAQQPRGVRLGLLSMDGSGSPMEGEFGAGPLSVIAPGGAPLCSVNAPYGTGTGAVCSTLSTGCPGEPDPRLTPDGAVAAGSPLAWSEVLLRAERPSGSRIRE